MLKDFNKFVRKQMNKIVSHEEMGLPKEATYSDVQNLRGEEESSMEQHGTSEG